MDIWVSAVSLGTKSSELKSYLIKAQLMSMQGPKDRELISSTTLNSSNVSGA